VPLLDVPLTLDRRHGQIPLRGRQDHAKAG
jgi:hypothetical protein